MTATTDLAIVLHLHNSLSEADKLKFAKLTALPQKVSSKPRQKTEVTKIKEYTNFYYQQFVAAGKI